MQGTLAAIEPVDQALVRAAQARMDSQIKPPRSLGRLEECARRVAGITRRAVPVIERKVVVTCGGDHGVLAEGVSVSPVEVTREMMRRMVQGDAGISVLARHAGARLVVVDIGVAGSFDPGDGVLDRKLACGTENIARGPAMTRELAVAAVETGIGLVEELAEGGLDLLGTGEMGVGNTTPSAAIIACLGDLPPAQVTGRGGGIDEATLRHKIGVVETALAVNRPDPADPLGVLAKVGGFEIGAIAGLVLGGAAHRVPVVVDGFIATAGALIAQRLCSAVTDYIFAAHRSAELGHGAMLESLGSRPLLDLDMRLGEGTGAVVAMQVIEAGVRVLAEMARFDDSEVPLPASYLGDQDDR